MKHSIDGRGVAHLVRLDGVQVQPSQSLVVSPRGRLADRRTLASPESIEAAAKLVRKALRPVVVAGDGARAGRAQLLSWAGRLCAPILTTYKATALWRTTTPWPPAFWDAVAHRSRAG